MKTAIIKRIVTGTLALVMAFAAIPAAETISGTNILSVTSYAASPDEFTQYDLDCCIDAWENFKANGRGYLLVNYWSNEIEKKAVYACQSMLNLVAEERGGDIISTDSIYGPASRNRCKQYQASRSLEVDGYLGNATFNALVSDCREILALREIKAGSSVTAPASVNASSGFATFDVVIQGTNITAASYNSTNADITLLNQYGNLADGIHLTFKAENVKSDANAVVKITTTKGMYETKIEISKLNYNVDKAIEFAKTNAYRNSQWLCAEYASRVARAGGLPIDIYPGCGDLFRALEKLDEVTKYELAVNSNGSINPNSAANKGKISEGDIVLIVCDDCAPYKYNHAVVVGDCSGSVARVYAHNSAHKNDMYYGFNYCSDHGHSGAVHAYCFHIG